VVVVQKTDAQGCPGRLEEDSTCADEKMRGSELLGGVARLGHGRYDCDAIPGLVCVCMYKEVWIG